MRKMRNTDDMIRERWEIQKYEKYRNMRNTDDTTSTTSYRPEIQQYEKYRWYDPRNTGKIEIWEIQKYRAKEIYSPTTSF